MIAVCTGAVALDLGQDGSTPLQRMRFRFEDEDPGAFGQGRVTPPQCRERPTVSGRPAASRSTVAASQSPSCDCQAAPAGTVGDQTFAGKKSQYWSAIRVFERNIAP